MGPYLGTADFMVHHIHAFTIHVALLILSKDILYARNSRLVSDKLELGFRYQCDGCIIVFNFYSIKALFMVRLIWSYACIIF